MKEHFKKLFFSILFFSCIFSLCGFVHAAQAKKEEVSISAPKLSVVVPVYNVAAYLDEALDSVENQTYKDLEIICVNDGSTDNSLEILEKHAQKDSRIKIITQENQGLAGARNTGLRAAKGQYIHFFDSDDVLVPYAMEKAIGLLEKYNADASEFKRKYFDCDITVDTSKFEYKELPVKILERKGNKNPFNVFGFRPISACLRVYRKSFLDSNKLEFKKELRVIEDVLFNYFSRACMKKLVKDGNEEYFYRAKRPGSIMNTDFKVLTRRLDAKLIILHELGSNKDRFKFPKSDEWLVGSMLELVYEDINRLENKIDKSSYASKAYQEIWTNFAKKYNVKINGNNQKKLNNLKSLFEDKKAEAKTKNSKSVKKSKKQESDKKVKKTNKSKPKTKK